MKLPVSPAQVFHLEVIETILFSGLTSTAMSEYPNRSRGETESRNTRHVPPLSVTTEVETVAIDSIGIE